MCDPAGSREACAYRNDNGGINALVLAIRGHEVSFGERDSKCFTGCGTHNCSDRGGSSVAQAFVEATQNETNHGQARNRGCTVPHPLRQLDRMCEICSKVSRGLAC